MQSEDVQARTELQGVLFMQVWCRCLLWRLCAVVTTKVRGEVERRVFPGNAIPRAAHGPDIRILVVVRRGKGEKKILHAHNAL
jgi:hypothetical protein